MKTYNSPAQARNLREIEVAASMATNSHEDHGAVQSVQPVEAPETEKAGPETETQSPAKKARGKKNPKAV